MVICSYTVYNGFNCMLCRKVPMTGGSLPDLMTGVFYPVLLNFLDQRNSK